MGGINIKLMQGVDDAEKQLQKEKQSQKAEKPMREETETRNTQKADGKSQTAKKQSKAKNTPIRKKDEKEADKILKKQVFSFRAVVADITIWRAYAIAKGETIENLGNAAMEEYIKRHKLLGTELAIFEALKVREGIGREEEGC